MRIVPLLLALLGFAGCLESSVTVCSSGRVCAVGRACDDVHDVCVAPDQLVDCVGDLDGATCATTTGAGQCLDEVCFQQVCGDGVATGSEACDLDDLLVTDCRDLGWHVAGVPTCATDCTIAGCSGGICGDATVDVEFELCDAAPGIPIADCQELGFYEPGPVTCNQCRYDDLQCAGSGFCGDGTHQAEHEQCDGAALPDTSCIDFGYEAGRLGCENCAPTYDACGMTSWQRLPSFTTTPLEAAWQTGGSFFLVGQNGDLVRLDGEIVTRLHNGVTQLYDVWGSSASDVFAVGASGTIVHWDGAVASVTTPTTVALRGISGTAANDIYAVGDTGVILHFDGMAWSTVTSPTTNALEAVWAESSRVIAVGAAGTIIVDSGGGFVAMPSSVTTTLHDVWGNWAVGDASVVLRFDGVSWIAVPRPSLGDGNTAMHFQAVWGTAPDDVYLAGRTEYPSAPLFEGLLAHFDGQLWTVPPVPPGDIQALAGTAPNQILAVGEAGVTMRFEGSAWGRGQGTDFFGDWNAVWGSAPGDVYVAMSNGFVDRLDGANRTVNVYDDPSNLDLFAIYGTGAGEIVAVGETGLIIRFDGTTWNRLVVGTQTLRGVWGIAGDRFAVGDLGTILRKQGGGVWMPMASGTTRHLRGVFGFAASDVYAVGDGGTILHFDGGTWTPMTVGSTTNLHAVWGSRATDVYVVGDDATIFHRDATMWSTMTVALGGNLRAISGTAADDVFVASDLGEVAHRDGVAWGRVRLDTGVSFLGIWGTARHVLFVGREVVDPFLFGHPSHLLLRTVPWSCRTIETACSDGVDDDCDGLRDAADPDC